jgi:Domain of unknown function (DUF4395)
MKSCKPVEIPHNAFHFCRWTLATLLWAALIFHWQWMLLITLILFILSAWLKIGHAPLIALYAHTLERLFPSSSVILDEHAMCFAHSFGATLNALCLFLIYFGYPFSGWILVGFMAVVKSIGAFGFCTPTKLYNCMNSDTCCRFIKRRSC